MSTCHSLLKLRFSAFYDNILAIMKKKKGEKKSDIANSGIHLFLENENKGKLFPPHLKSLSFPYSLMPLDYPKWMARLTLPFFHLYFIRKTSAFLVANLFDVNICKAMQSLQ